MNKQITFYTLSAVVLVVVFFAGLSAVKYMTNKVEQDERANLLLRAQTVAALIDKENLRALTGTSNDTNTNNYTQVRLSLENVHRVNTDTRFVYILGMKETTMYFIADAEPETSKDYSAPGDVYSDATDEDKQNYAERLAYTKGPYTDAWGNWFSAYAPIIDTDGNMLGQLTMDIDSQKLLLRIDIVRQATIVVFSLLFLAILTVLALVRDSFIVKK